MARIKVAFTKKRVTIFGTGILVLFLTAGVVVGLLWNHARSQDESYIVERPEVSIQQDLDWGVLAINPSQNVYQKGDTAYLTIGILDEKGLMVCDSNLRLEITSPSGQMEKFSTDEGTITMNENCFIHDFTHQADFDVEYQLEEEGWYMLSVKGINETGEYEITDALLVDNNYPIDVYRRSATRIYPISEYPVEFTVRAEKSGPAKVIERIPKDFKITQLSDYEMPEIREEGEHKVLTWEVDMIDGGELDFGYIYKAPIDSPEFYSFEPLEVVYKENESKLRDLFGMVPPSYFEARNWMIASDAVTHDETVTGSATGNPSSVTTSSSVTATNDNLYLAAISGKPQPPISSVTGLGLTWTLVDSQCGGRDVVGLAVYKAQGTPSGSGTVTANFSDTSANTAVIAVTSFSGVHTSSPIGDFQSANTNGDDGACSGGSDDSSPSTSITTTQADSVIYGAVATRNKTLTQGTGYTLRTNISTGTGGDDSGIGTEDKTQASTGSVSVDGSLSGSADWVITGIEVKTPPTTKTISGTAFTDEGSSTMGANKTINLRINGAGTYTDETDTNGDWSVPNLTISSGDIISVYIDNETGDQAVTVFESDGTSQSDVDLYEDHVIMRTDTGTLSLTDMNTGDDGDTDIQYVADTSGGRLEILSADKLYVWPSSTVNLAAYLELNDITETLKIKTNADLTVAGSGQTYLYGTTRVETGAAFHINGDSFIDGSLVIEGDGVIDYTSGTPELEVLDTSSIGGGTTPTYEFYDINISGGSHTLTITDDIVVNNDLTIGSGTTLTGADSVTVEGGDVTGAGTINMTGETFTVEGTGNFGGSTNGWTFNNLVFGDGTTTATSTSTNTGGITVSGVLTINASHTLNAGSKTWTLSGSGTPFVSSGTFTASTSTFQYTSTSATNITAETYNDVSLSPPSGTVTYTFEGGTVENWYDPDWLYRKKMTIDNTKVSGSTNLTDFVAYVYLASDSDLAADAQGDFDDIVFTDSNHNKLNHEIEKYNSGTGQLLAWVEIPTVYYNTDTEFYMYYGNGTIGSQQSESTWDTTYSGVWHMDDDPSGTAPQLLDSTSYSNDGTSSGSMTDTDVVGAQIGDGIIFDGNDDTFTVPDDTTLEPAGADDFTASFWFYGDSADETVEVEFINNGGGPGWRIKKTNPGEIYMQLRDGSTTKQAEATVDPTFDDDWHYIVYVKDVTADTFTEYYDGYQSGNIANAQVGDTNNGDDILIGNNAPIILDEVRLIKDARTADWILTEFRNQDAVGTFYKTLGTEENKPTGGSGDLVANNLTLAGAGDVTGNMNANDPVIQVDGDFTIGSGDLFQASATEELQIAGDFTNNGTFTHNSGTVRFLTTDTETILSYAANTTFGDVIINTGTKKMLFDTNYRTIVSGDLTVSGGACGTPTKLYSDTRGIQYELEVTGTDSVEFAHIRDSNAINALAATDSIQRGNTTAWTITNGTCSPPSPANNELLKHGGWWEDNEEQEFSF